MRFEIVLAPEAVQTMKALPAFHRATIRDALETHLRHEPAKVSKSRIKVLRGLSQPQFRLRVDEFRVFYDISGQEVQVLAIVSKEEAEAWLAEYGQGEAGGRSRRG
jgi:mRNA interferase RelE/StbE